MELPLPLPELQHPQRPDQGRVERHRSGHTQRRCRRLERRSPVVLRSLFPVAHRQLLCVLRAKRLVLHVLSHHQPQRLPAQVQASAPTAAALRLSEKSSKSYETLSVLPRSPSRALRPAGGCIISQGFPRPLGAQVQHQTTPKRVQLWDSLNL